MVGEGVGRQDCLFHEFDNEARVPADGPSNSIATGLKPALARFIHRNVVDGFEARPGNHIYRTALNWLPTVATKPADK